MIPGQVWQTTKAFVLYGDFASYPFAGAPPHFKVGDYITVLSDGRILTKHGIKYAYGWELFCMVLPPEDPR